MTPSDIWVGDQPNKMLLSTDQRRLYVANGESDTVSVIDTGADRLAQPLSLAGPGDRYKGAISNSLTQA